jgi:hypothetical protein
MKKFSLLFLIFIVWYSYTVFAQEYDFGRHLNYLAADSLNGRLAGSREDSLTADYIRAELRSYGYRPLCEGGWQNFDCVMSKTIAEGMQLERVNARSRNVVMMLVPHNKSMTTELFPESIVIGAHFDHLGTGGVNSGSRTPHINAVHNGADDNASGVAMILELAKRLSQDDRPLKRNILIVAFGAEEQGLVGSKYFIEHIPEEAGNVVMMINFDMIGRLDSLRNFHVGGIGTFDGAEQLVRSITNPDSLKFVISHDGYGSSDHLPFYANGVPVLYFHTGVHFDYHTPSDKIEKINYAGMKSIADLVYPVIYSISTAENPPVYQKVGDSQQEIAPQRRFKVTLGLVPDFNGVYEGQGMRADFITEGKPASKAGMKNGDIILSINGIITNNIDDYMKCLSELKAGEAVVVKVQRGEEILMLSVQL